MAWSLGIQLGPESAARAAGFTPFLATMPQPGALTNRTATRTITAFQRLCNTANTTPENVLTSRGSGESPLLVVEVRHARDSAIGSALNKIRAAAWRRRAGGGRAAASAYQATHGQGFALGSSGSSYMSAVKTGKPDC